MTADRPKAASFLATMDWRVRAAACLLEAAALLLGPQALGQSADGTNASLPAGTPEWLAPAWRDSLGAPRRSMVPLDTTTASTAPTTTCTTPKCIFDSGGIPSVIDGTELDIDTTGANLSFQPAGPVTTASNAFFQPLGSNGRACITCHQPSSGMSVSVGNIQARFAANSADPIFDAVDGANCPDSAIDPSTSLLLQRGLFRIFLPVPRNAQFTVSVWSDPYGCAATTDPNTGAQILSFYRRPLITANLPFIVKSLRAPNAPTRLPAIMWDERETSLGQQATDATLVHAQALVAPTSQQLAQIEGFEMGLFAAQQQDTAAGGLSASGARGGPVALSRIAPAINRPGNSITAYSAWSGLTGSAVDDQRASIARGQVLFNAPNIFINNVAGFTFTRGGSACSSCHRELGSANDTFGHSVAFDLGVGGGDFGGPAPDQNLPIYRVTCTGNNKTQFNGNMIFTNDLGKAMITGQCTDLEKFKTPQLRALASRPPYFSDGSAATLLDVVNFYDARFSIGLLPQDKQDLANFLAAL